MSAGLIAAGLVSAYGAMLNNAYNREAQQRENNITRMREDNAYQRAVRDAKLAGLSPLVASQNGGASAQALTAPQNTQNPIDSLVAGSSTASQISARNSQIDLNNSQSSKLAAETRGQEISNAFAMTEHAQALLKERYEIAHLEVTNERERIYKNNMLRLLDAQIKEMTANASLSNARSVEQVRATAVSKLDANWNANHSLPFGTTHSKSHSGVFGSGLSADELTAPLHNLVDKYNVDDLSNAGLNNGVAIKEKHDKAVQAFERDTKAWQDEHDKLWKQYYEQSKSRGYSDEKARKFADYAMNHNHSLGPKPNAKDYGL